MLINVKKTSEFKTVFNGDTAYITTKTATINVNMPLSNSTFLIFAVLVV